MNLRIFLIALVALIVAATLVACNGEADEGNEATTGDDRLLLVATTGMIADALKNIAGDRAEVIGLMGPGVDPHLYKPTPSSLDAMKEGDMIFYNGLHLEGRMGDVLEKLAANKPVIAFGETLNKGRLRRPAEFDGNFDPHIWFDVALWREAVGGAVEALAKHDPEHGDLYRKNAVAYLVRLDSLDRWVREQIASIPKDRRVLVTAHDAFGYFGRAYDIDVRGLQGISTVSNYGLADIRGLVDLIVERKVKAVFIESSVPKASIDALVRGVQDRGHDVKIGGELFSDAMGEEGTPAGTYVGMVEQNVRTITEALR